jgi:hypothetical protein
MPSFDMYERPVSHGIGPAITHFCPDCGNSTVPGEEYCKGCQAEREIFEISCLKMDRFLDLLDALFEGEEKKFRMDAEGELWLTYCCTDKDRIAKAGFMLSAYCSTRYKVVAEGIEFPMVADSQGYGSSELRIA